MPIGNTDCFWDRAKIKEILRRITHIVRLQIISIFLKDNQCFSTNFETCECNTNCWVSM